MRIWLDLPTATKVLIAFASMLFLTCVLGLVGLRESGLINDSAAEVRDNWLPSTVAIGKLGAAGGQYRVREARLLLGHLAGSAADLAEDQAYLAEGMAMVEKLRQEYEPLITRGTDDERLMREFDQALIRVKQTGEQVIALVKSGGKPAEMVTLFRQEGRATFDLAVSKTAEDLAFNQAEGVKAANLVPRRLSRHP